MAVELINMLNARERIPGIHALNLNLLIVSLLYSFLSSYGNGKPNQEIFENDHHPFPQLTI
jgi:hypothetical protein